MTIFYEEQKKKHYIIKHRSKWCETRYYIPYISPYYRRLLFPDGETIFFTDNCETALFQKRGWYQKEKQIVKKCILHSRIDWLYILKYK